jgi:hypothetical protein
MHGNTRTSPLDASIKTRAFGDIVTEVVESLAVHAQEGSRLGGVHLELTGEVDARGESVTECVGGSMELSAEDLSRRYMVSRQACQHATMRSHDVLDALRPTPQLRAIPRHRLPALPLAASSETGSGSFTEPPATYSAGPPAVARATAAATPDSGEWSSGGARDGGTDLGRARARHCQPAVSVRKGNANVSCSWCAGMPARLARLRRVRPVLCQHGRSGRLRGSVVLVILAVLSENA